MKINKKTFFAGFLSGLCVPVSFAAPNVRQECTLSSFKPLYEKYRNRSDDEQMYADFLAVGNDIRQAISKYGTNEKK